MTDRRQPRDPHGGETKQACCVPAERRGEAARSSSSPPVNALQVQDIRYNDEFVSIPGGASYLGTDQPLIPDDGEGPRKRVQIKPFRMAKTAVTNSQFAAFVDSTDYVTEAELFGWSLVFWQFADPAIQYQRVAATPWWCKVDGASWARPFGPKSDVTGIEDHPVTHVSWHDAQAYSAWMGGRLPTEAEWEYAAHGGNDDLYPWGKDEPNDTDTQPSNIWQGSFPEQNTCADGYAGTAPAISFEPNGYGFYNMSGNTWEWIGDAFRIRSLKRGAKLRNAAAAEQKEKVLKGGSYLCHKSYCYRYRIAARTAATPESSTGHMGFRVVLPAI